MRLIVADDDPDMLMSLQDWLQASGHDVQTALDAETVFSLLERCRPHLLFLDIEMPGMSGLEALRRLQAGHADLPVIIMTGHATIAIAVEAMKMGAADFITKPFQYSELEAVMAKAVERRRLEGEVTRLLGEISHEIKNLLMPVVCGSDLLESEIGDLIKRLPELEAVKAQESRHLCAEVIEMLRRAADRIQDRTKGIADYVKVSQAPVVFASCRIADIAANVLKVLRLPADVRGVALRVEGLDSMPLIQADEPRLFAVLYNLVNNAIAEVPAGGSVTVAGGATDNQAVCLSVRDTGRGMPPAVRDAVLTERAMSMKPGGSGLGLRIVREAVALHGGTISLESEEGRGTTFYLRLPLRPTPPTRARSTDS
jgi:signal transduction histidine kinase